MNLKEILVADDKAIEQKHSHQQDGLYQHSSPPKNEVMAFLKVLEEFTTL